MSNFWGAYHLFVVFFSIIFITYFFVNRVEIYNNFINTIDSYTTNSLINKFNRKFNINLENYIENEKCGHEDNTDFQGDGNYVSIFKVKKEKKNELESLLEHNALFKKFPMGKEARLNVFGEDKSSITWIDSNKLRGVTIGYYSFYSDKYAEYNSDTPRDLASTSGLLIEYDSSECLVYLCEAYES